jgi:hypothetical protein
MQNDKAFFTVLIQPNRFQQAQAVGSAVTRQITVYVPAVKTLLAMISAGLWRGYVFEPAMEADKRLVDLLSSGHGTLQVRQNYGRILGLKLIKGKYGN